MIDHLINTYFIHECSLNFNDTKLNDIINEIYQLEKEGKYNSKSGRTFKINKGFHSVNIIDPKYKILEKYENIKILCSRIQELLMNYLKTNQINWVDNCYGTLKIKEIWINILRITDYNIPHNHPNNELSGNFYLKTITKKCCETDGSLIFLNKSNHHYYLPEEVQNSGSVTTIYPKKNLGIIFNSYHKHIVMPHFSDEDRIGVAFNAVYDPEWNYDKIYPIPYWLPLEYTYIIQKEDIEEDKNIINIKFKNEIILHNRINKNINLKNYIGKTFLISKENMIKDITTIDKKKYFIV